MRASAHNNWHYMVIAILGAAGILNLLDFGLEISGYRSSEHALRTFVIGVFFSGLALSRLMHMPRPLRARD